MATNAIDERLTNALRELRHARALLAMATGSPLPTERNYDELLTNFKTFLSAYADVSKAMEQEFNDARENDRKARITDRIVRLDLVCRILMQTDMDLINNSPRRME